ncbi:MAG: hypothetical protein COB20_06040 [SAR86 cluster bacterium]|uniref:Esterase n=1 Tax=SAR86 cluster bacterium TaxID=2030880 RepID=A0A2A4XA40_9GAMM|nr:MAG: hypothetical protein COB20_06040 [SAR86 cluster bacterium]
MKSLLRSLVLVTVTLLTQSHVFSQVLETRDFVSIRDTAQHVIRSRNVDETFRIDVGLPYNYSETDLSYPVVYVVDANGTFPIVLGNLRSLQLLGELPEVILIGIGYNDPNERFSSRNRDLTPTNDPVWGENRRRAPPRYAMAEDISTGGAEAYFNFIEEEVKPYISQTYRTDESSRTITGYSFGGLFGLYVLFNHSDSFDNYVLGSPSIYWDSRVSLSYEQNYADRENDLSKQVFIAMGGNESDEVRGNAEDLYNRLVSRSYPRLEIEYNVYEGETHLSGIGVMLNNGLRFIFSED